MGLFGFGGIAASLYHVAVERRKWMSVDEYAQTLAVGQILPGASLMNMSTIVADRFHGVLGVVCALLGLFTFPLIILVLLITTYDQYSSLPEVQYATKAAAAAAVKEACRVAAACTAISGAPLALARKSVADSE